MLPSTQIPRFIATTHFQRLHWSAETWKGLVEKPGATRENRDWPCTEQQSPGMLFTPSWPWIWRPTQVQLEILIDYDLETLRILLTPHTNWKFAGKNDISMSAFTFPVSAHLPLASTLNQAQHYALPALVAGGKWIESLRWPRTLSSFGRKGLHWPCRRFHIRRTMESSSPTRRNDGTMINLYKFN